jgi:hypothetical protein
MPPEPTLRERLADWWANINWTNVGFDILMAAAVVNTVLTVPLFAYLCVSVVMGWPIHPGLLAR